MKVRKLEGGCQWEIWNHGGKRSRRVERIGLQVKLGAGDTDVYGVRYRPSPDGIAKNQLNLNDLLDVMIRLLPSDAFAVVFLVDHDLYEDEEDDFCAGRAYGGSRVSVVSSLRYHPSLDSFADIIHEHMWPASHCTQFVDNLCELVAGNPKSPPNAGSRRS